MGLPAPPAGGGAASRARPALRKRPRARARDELGGAGGRHRPHPGRGGADMVRREIVGAHYGLRDWIAQRVTAVIMLVYTAVILSAIAGLPQMDYYQWKVLWRAPVVQYATVLFMASLLIHA